MKQINTITRLFAIVILIATSMVTKAQTQAVVRTAQAENKVAILPITYVGEGNAIRMDEMRYRLQTIAYQYLKDDAMELKFQDPAETNALLLKNGVNESTYRQFTPRELAAILQVEYVLTGMVSQENAGMSSMSHSNRSYYTTRKGRDIRETHRYTKTVQDMATFIDLDVYNDKGEKIYSKSRRSILTNMDAYKAGMHYLLKRSPLYRR